MTGLGTIFDAVQFVPDDLVPTYKRCLEPRSKLMEPAKIPLARVKRVMKEDPEVMAVSNVAVKHMAAAVQLFVAQFTEQAMLAARAEGRNKLSYRDFAHVANSNEEMEFLGPILPTTSPFTTVEALRDNADIHDPPGIPFPRRKEQLEEDYEDKSD